MDAAICTWNWIHCTQHTEIKSKIMTLLPPLDRLDFAKLEVLPLQTGAVLVDWLAGCIRPNDWLNRYYFYWWQRFWSALGVILWKRRHDAEERIFSHPKWNAFNLIPAENLMKIQRTIDVVFDFVFCGVWPLCSFHVLKVLPIPSPLWFPAG